jgi:hypothetical protein
MAKYICLYNIHAFICIKYLGLTYSRMLELYIWSQISCHLHHLVTDSVKAVVLECSLVSDPAQGEANRSDLILQQTVLGSKSNDISAKSQEGT